MASGNFLICPRVALGEGRRHLLLVFDGWLHSRGGVARDHEPTTQTGLGENLSAVQPLINVN